MNNFFKFLRSYPFRFSLAGHIPAHARGKGRSYPTIAGRYSESLRPFLRMVFANSKDMFERISKLFERHQ